MKVAITFELSTEDRLAIANFYGESKPSPRKDCRTQIEMVVCSMLEDLHANLQRHREDEADLTTGAEVPA